MSRTVMRGIFLLVSVVGIALLSSRGEPTAAEVPPAVSTSTPSLEGATAHLSPGRPSEQRPVVAGQRPSTRTITMETEGLPDDERQAEPELKDKRDAEEREIQALRDPG